jgi:hypothetical protein
MPGGPDQCRDDNHADQEKTTVGATPIPELRRFENPAPSASDGRMSWASGAPSSGGKYDDKYQRRPEPPPRLTVRAVLGAIINITHGHMATVARTYADSVLWGCKEGV